MNHITDREIGGASAEITGKGMYMENQPYGGTYMESQPYGGTDTTIHGPVQHQADTYSAITERVWRLETELMQLKSELGWIGPWGGQGQPGAFQNQSEYISIPFYEMNANAAAMPANVNYPPMPVPGTVSETNSQDKPKKKRRIPVVIVSNVLFYLVIICTVLGVFLLTGENNKPRNILGYSYFTVLTASMQSEIPRGSIVVTRHIDPAEIMIGNDITFFKSETTTVTHRVIDIIENYQDTGRRAFQTKGIDNPGPDKDFVIEQNIVGVVDFTVPNLGAALAYVKNNILLVSLMFALIILISVCMRIFFANGEKKEDKEVRSEKKKALPLMP